MTGKEKRVGVDCPDDIFTQSGLGESRVPKRRYQVLVVDPPWNQGKTGKRAVRPNQGTKLDYPTMSKQDLLEKLPIGEWADEQSFLWLWATNSKDKKTGDPILRTAFDLLEAWGFTFYTMVTWDNKTGPCPFGPYQVTTGARSVRLQGQGGLRQSLPRENKNLFYRGLDNAQRQAGFTLSDHQEAF